LCWLCPSYILNEIVKLLLNNTFIFLRFSFLTKLITCQNLQNKLLNITVLFIWYLLASLTKMSLAKHGELYFILASTCFSPLAVLASIWKKWFPTLETKRCIKYVCQTRFRHIFNFMFLLRIRLKYFKTKLFYLH
jgi:hypothetical protein